MIWKSHRIVTFMGVLTITQNPFAALVAGMGAVTPDSIELTLQGMIKHRTVTHWFPVYLLPLLVLYVYLNHYGFYWHTVGEAWNMVQTEGLANAITITGVNAMFWILVGCLCHIAEDLLTGYVPLLTPYDRRKIRILFYPGSSKEYFFDILFILVCVGINLVRMVYGGFHLSLI